MVPSAAVSTTRVGWLCLFLLACGNAGDRAEVRDEPAPPPSTESAPPEAPPEPEPEPEVEEPPEPLTMPTDVAMPGEGGFTHDAILADMVEARPTQFKPVGTSSVVFRVQTLGEHMFAFKPPSAVRARAASAEVAAYRLGRLLGYDNVEFRHEDLSAMGIADGSCDFGYSLGVLHHVPDTEDATRACVRKLKPGAPFLVYLYYDLEGRGWLQRRLFNVATVIRAAVSRLPSRARGVVADVLATVMYWPLARTARLLEKAGLDPSLVPLFQYRHRSFYVMRNDSLDRFGTRLEKRYSKDEVRVLLEGAGLEKVEIADGPPWWVAIGWRERVAG